MRPHLPILADLADSGYLYNGIALPLDFDGPIGGLRAVNGIKAYVITDGADTYAFSAVGPPRPIQFISKHGAQRMRFDHYDAPLTVKAPPPDEVVALPRSF